MHLCKEESMVLGMVFKHFGYDLFVQTKYFMEIQRTKHTTGSC